MHATSPATIAVAMLSAAAISWLGIGRFYGSFPEFPWLPPLTLLGLAVSEAVAARQTRAWIRRKAGARPVPVLLVARYLVLAKASALASAIFAGWYLGMVAWLVVQLPVLQHAGRDLPAAVGGAVGALLLVVASLVLERTCRVPPDPTNHDQPRSRPK